jgi:hypothetical protein
MKKVERVTNSGLVSSRSSRLPDRACPYIRQHFFTFFLLLHTAKRQTAGVTYGMKDRPLEFPSVIRTDFHQDLQITGR